MSLLSQLNALVPARTTSRSRTSAASPLLPPITSTTTIFVRNTRGATSSRNSSPISCPGVRPPAVLPSGRESTVNEPWFASSAGSLFLVWPDAAVRPTSRGSARLRPDLAPPGDEPAHQPRRNGWRRCSTRCAARSRRTTWFGGRAGGIKDVIQVSPEREAEAVDLLDAAVDPREDRVATEVEQRDYLRRLWLEDPAVVPATVCGPAPQPEGLHRMWRDRAAGARGIASLQEIAGVLAMAPGLSSPACCRIYPSTITRSQQYGLHAPAGDQPAKSGTGAAGEADARDLNSPPEEAGAFW